MSLLRNSSTTGCEKRPFPAWSARLLAFTDYRDTFILNVRWLIGLNKTVNPLC